jgi:hypothetical protein
MLRQDVNLLQKKIYQHFKYLLNTEGAFGVRKFYLHIIPKFYFGTPEYAKKFREDTPHGRKILLHETKLINNRFVRRYWK